MMDESRFRALVEAYGADPGRWPEAEREAALDFVNAEGEGAQRLLDEAAELDHLLTAAVSVSADSALETAILANVPGRKRTPQLEPSPRWAGIAAGVALMLGAGVGWAAAPASDPYADLVLAEAFGTLSGEQALDALSEEDAR
jgi:hypothetical protein